MIRFAQVPDLVLGPLAGHPDADWHAAPRGKWSPAQIVQHLALGLEYSGRTFDARRHHAPMRRRPRTAREFAGYLSVIGLGWYPSGRKAPAAARPTERPDAAAVERQFRGSAEKLVALERELLPARRYDLFVKHPALGDLTLPEWLRFHVYHCTHHAKQIEERLRR
jgi:hypothetical protein